MVVWIKHWRKFPLTIISDVTWQPEILFAFDSVDYGWLGSFEMGASFQVILIDPKSLKKKNTEHVQNKRINFYC